MHVLLERICRLQSVCVVKQVKFLVQREYIVGDRENRSSYYQHFLQFPTVFSKIPLLYSKGSSTCQR